MNFRSSIFFSVEGRKRTFPLAGPYIPPPYTSGDADVNSEMSRTVASSGNNNENSGNNLRDIAPLYTSFTVCPLPAIDCEQDSQDNLTIAVSSKKL